MLPEQCLFKEAVRSGWVRKPPVLYDKGVCVGEAETLEVKSCCYNTARAVDPARQQQVVAEQLLKNPTDGSKYIALLAASAEIGG